MHAINISRAKLMSRYCRLSHKLYRKQGLNIFSDWMQWERLRSKLFGTRPSGAKWKAAAVALTVALSSPFLTAAQEFAPAAMNPFGLNTIPVIYDWQATVELADIDHDGDKDLFVGCDGGATLFFENTGTPGSPAFGSYLINPFGIANIDGTRAPNFVDLDADGDLDLMNAALFTDFYYQENIGTMSEPLFDAPQLNPFGITDGGYYDSQKSPEFCDLDGDGDWDFLSGFFELWYPFPVYYQNTGTPASPAFAFPEHGPFGLDELYGCAYMYSHAAVGDVDNDGDQDILVGDQDGSCMYENTGTPIAPAFAMNADFISFSGYNVKPCLSDLDADGDLDLITLSGYYGDRNFFYYENMDCNLAIPVDLNATSVTPTSASLSWSPADEGYDFVVKIRDLTAGGIRKKYVSEPAYTFNSLTPGHDYAFTVWTECADFGTRRGPSDVFYFSTPLRQTTTVQTFNVFPNPTTGEIQLDLSAFTGDHAQAVIMNVVGEVVQTIDLAQHTDHATLQMPEMPGVYVLMISDSGYNGMVMVVKQ